MNRVSILLMGGIILALCLRHCSVYSQVAVNDDDSDPDQSAMMDIKSINRGLLIPRMTTTQRNNISSPATGLLVYVTDDNNYYFWNGSFWRLFSGGSDGDWTISGNNLFSSVSGNVGIGNNNPSEKLSLRTPSTHSEDMLRLDNDISSVDDWIGILFSRLNGINNMARIGAIADGGNSRGLFFETNAGSGLYEAMRLSGAGNLGIGTMDPGEKLHIEGSIRMVDGNQGAGRVMISDAFGTGSWADASAVADDDWNTSINDLHRIAGSDTLVSIVSNGNVGIGTAFPSAKLDIRGSGIDDGVVLSVGNSDASHRLQLFGGRENDPNPFIQWKTGDPLRFSTDEGGWSEKMRITSEGDVGIGTTSPQGLLHVMGDTAASGVEGKDIILEAGDGGLGANGGKIILLPKDGNFANSNSKVGIGTTDPNCEMHLYGPGIRRFMVESSTSSNVSMMMKGTNQFTELTINDMYALIVMDHTHSSAPFMIKSSGVSVFSHSMGIGLSNPVGRLHVAGDEVRIGDGGTVNYISGNGDLYIQNVLEVDGSGYLQGDLDVGGNADVGNQLEVAGNLFQDGEQRRQNGVFEYVFSATGTTDASGNATVQVPAALFVGGDNIAFHYEVWVSIDYNSGHPHSDRGTGYISGMGWKERGTGVSGYTTFSSYYKGTVTGITASTYNSNYTEFTITTNAWIKPFKFNVKATSGAH